MGILCGHAKNRDINSMWAGVSALNVPAIKFHEGLDFKIVARLPEVGYKFGTFVDGGIVFVECDVLAMAAFG